MERNFKYYVVGFALFGFCLWIFANFYGLGTTHDSFYYLTLRPSLDAIFRPQLLFPWLLSWFSNPIRAAFWINGVSLLITYLVWCQLISQTTSSSRLKVWAIGIITCSLPVLLISSFIWTEALYLCITILAIYGFYQWQSNRSLLWLLVFCISGLLSIWARKIGLIFCASAVIVVATEYIKKPLHKNLFTGLSMVALFLYWKWFYQGETPEWQYVTQNFIFNANGLINWFLPVSFPPIVRIAFLVAFLIFLFLVRPIRTPINQLIITYFLIYFLIRLPVEREDPEEADRYFAILFPMAIFLFIQIEESFLNRFGRFRARMTVLLVLFLILSIVRSLYHARFWHLQRREKTTTTALLKEISDMPPQILSKVNPHPIQPLSLRQIQKIKK